jgi:hypothetical protein
MYQIFKKMMSKISLALKTLVGCPNIATKKLIYIYFFKVYLTHTKKQKPLISFVNPNPSTINS